MSVDLAAPAARRVKVGNAKRRDIQALRAVAVLSVVAYHVWPGVLGGGFVGVDVFFVISGFLITSHLMAKPPVKPSDFARFWARRVLRLLPAVAVVVLATLVAALLWMPQAQWTRMAHEGIASMFYVENWRLIADATDYLDAHSAVSPFQHFWSLSVEEQYYLGWPLLIALLALAGRRRVTFLGLGIVVAGSLYVSVTLTASSPDVAYFSTFARIWELGIGSLLAVAYPTVRRMLASPSARVASLLAGAAAIAGAMLFIRADDAFPGAIALIPTLGTAAVIAADDPDHRFNPRRLLHSRPVQFVGDQSYSLYLWHWPLVVMTPYVVGHGRRLRESIVIVVLSLLAAWLSTRLIEDPIRRSRLFAGRTRRILLGGAALSLVVTAASVGIAGYVHADVSRSQRRVDSMFAGKEACVGAAAMDPARQCESERPLITSPAFAKADMTNGILGCLNWPPFRDPVVSCTLGTAGHPVKRLALFGNSHAGHWVEALQRIAKRNHWRVDTFVVGVCSSTDAYHAVDHTTGTDEKQCQRMNHSIVERIASGGYDGVVLSTMDRDPASTPSLYANMLSELSATTPVLVIRDTPAPMDQNNPPPDCVAEHLDDVKACGGTPTTWIGPDPLAQAARDAHSARVGVLDLNRFLCTKTFCPAVIGGVIVYSDFNHMSKTFSRTLVPYLEPSLKNLVSGARTP